jgi:GNAT superfamily N-acetyltransferase
VTPEVRVAAAEADLPAIAEVAAATGQDDDWGGTNPGYLRHLMTYGRVVVADVAGSVVGFGAVQQIGTGSDAVTILCDLFVDPAVQGRGCGRAMLSNLWNGAARRMTFSSLNSRAMPLYTSFGLDAWWPLLYLHGPTDRLPIVTEWAVESVTPEAAAGYELGWTGSDRLPDLRAWAARPGGACVLVSADDEAIAAGAVRNSGRDRGIVHLSISPAADDSTAAAVVLLTLAHLTGPEASAHVCLPAPHPAVRALLAAGWQFDEFDVFMATDIGLIDPRRAVPSPAQA